MSRTGPPGDSVCRICRRVAVLVWDHCHPCGPVYGERGWICSACNTALTEHIETHWEAAGAYLSEHVHKTLPGIDAPVAQPQPRDNAVTRRLRMGQGPNDPRYVMASEDRSMMTVEQVAVSLGIVPGSARDLLWGRRSRRGVLIEGTVFAAVPTTIELMQERGDA